MSGTFGSFLIWQFGEFSSNHQIKITANTVVLSQVLIRLDLMMNELICLTKYPLICFPPKSPNLMSTKCTTHTIYRMFSTEVFSGFQFGS